MMKELHYSLSKFKAMSKTRNEVDQNSLNFGILAINFNSYRHKYKNAS